MVRWMPIVHTGTHNSPVHCSTWNCCNMQYLVSHGYVFICHTIDTFDTYIQCAVQPVHSYLQYHTIMCNQMTLSSSKTCQLKLSPGCLHLFITHYIICCCDFNCYCLIEIIYLDTRWASVSIRHWMQWQGDQWAAGLTPGLLGRVGRVGKLFVQIKTSHTGIFIKQGEHLVRLRLIQ